MIDLDSYDFIIVAYSGGKDSTACVLHLLELGIPKEKIELWHHDVDGRNKTFMDWAITPAYCREFAFVYGLKIYFSWKEGGFERELLRKNSLTAPIYFETPDGLKHIGGTRGKKSTRRKFPQVSGNLAVRWCSAYLKIDVGSAALRNQHRFLNKRTLFVTGERAEESTARAKYKVFEPDRTDNRGGQRNPRHVDHWRPVHKWKEKTIWNILKRNNVRAHPAYYLGWGRLSCATCIFGSKNQWTSYSTINPGAVEKIARYEEEFNSTIRRDKSVRELIDEGKPYLHVSQRSRQLKALSKEFSSTIHFIDEPWQLPAGAYGEACGPS